MGDADAAALRRGMLLVLAGAVIISFSPVFVKVARVGPTATGFYRNLFGAAVLVPVLAAQRDRLWNGVRPALWAAVAGLFFAADLSFWHRSIEYVGPGLATILANFQVFFLAAVGVAVFREPLTWRLAASVPLGVAGLFLLVGVEWGALAPDYRWGVVLGIFTAVAYTGYVLSLRTSQRLEVRISPTANLTLVSLATATIMGVEGGLQGESFAIPDARSWAALLAYGALCQALGWIAISRGIARVGASRVGLLLLLQPTLAFVWDMLLFGRPTTFAELSGAALALGAVYLGSAPARSK